MAKKPTHFEINGRTYIIGDWVVDKQLETLVWLTKTFGEGILHLFMSEEGLEGVDNLLGSKPKPEEEVKLSEEEAKEKKKRERDAVADLVQRITKNLSAKEYVAYMKHILDGVHCGGQKVNFSLHFVGRIGELHQVAFNVLRHQYGDFLGASTVEDQ
jgi:hypothetical protein